MASSTYYYQQYQAYKGEVEDYEDNIKELKNIKDSLSGDLYDEQSNINKELEDLKEDLNKSVRHDNKFNNIASDCYKYKEKTTSADGKLNGAIIALENEISSLETKKGIAEQNRDSNYSLYERRKKEELEEAAKALEG